MSWQSYVDTSLVGTGHIDKAAIFSKAGDSVWATSQGFNITPQEIQAIIKGLTEGGRDTLFAEGFKLATEKYLTTGAEPNDALIIGKKGKEGVIIKGTKQAIIIGHYPETVQPGNANTTVQALGDYLIGLGY